MARSTRAKAGVLAEPSIEVWSTESATGFGLVHTSGGATTVRQFFETMNPPFTPTDEMRAAAALGASFVSVLRLPAGRAAVLAMRPTAFTRDNRLGGARSVVVEYAEGHALSYALGIAIGLRCNAFEPRDDGVPDYGELGRSVGEVVAEAQRAPTREPSPPAPELIDHLGGVAGLGLRYYLRITGPVPPGEIAAALDDAGWPARDAVSLVAGAPKNVQALSLDLGPVLVLDEPRSSAFLPRSTELTVGVHVRGGWEVERRTLADVGAFVDKVAVLNEVPPSVEMVGQLEDIYREIRSLARDGIAAPGLAEKLEDIARDCLLAPTDTGWPPSDDGTRIVADLQAFGLGHGVEPESDPWNWVNDESQSFRALLAAAFSLSFPAVDPNLRWSLLMVGVLGPWNHEVQTLVRSGDVGRLALASAAAHSTETRRRAVEHFLPTDRSSLAAGIRRLDPAFQAVTAFIGRLRGSRETLDAVVRQTLTAAREVGLPGFETAVTLGLLRAGARHERIFELHVQMR